MKRTLLLAVTLCFFIAPLLAQEAQEANPAADLNALAATIRTELEAHGERVMGQDAYRWSTHLESISNCRAEFSVRISNNVGLPTVQTEYVEFSLGSMDSSGIVPQKNWLDIPCLNKEKCIISNSACLQRSKEGIVTDCSTASTKRTNLFSLELDDEAAISRMQQVFSRAIEICRQPASVDF